MTDEIKWGPTGQLVYERTYARAKPNGEKETWHETVERVVDGNLALVDPRYIQAGEREQLIELMTDFRITPAGRHLWASGVKNAQHLFNCWVSGWTETPSDHFEFTFMRLMEGGGVGANYSNRFLADYPPVQQELYVHIVCDEEHPDYEAMKSQGILSTEYDPDWVDAFQIEDSREGWAAALVDLIDTFYREDVSHYNRVYDVSRVRAAGTKLRTFGGRASGPAPLGRMLIDICEILSESHWCSDKLTGMEAMEIDHAIAQCVVAGGVRRSARMAMMHWADPQIGEFLKCKSETGKHWTTNISVEVDEEFWRSEGLRKIQVLNAISKGMVDNGEPGFWDSSLSNVGEPNEVVCTNPCGEITLEPWEPCNLGHINLAGFVTENGKVDWINVIRAHRLMTRFLIRATFSPVGDPKSREVLDRNRRIGVGHLGVASFLALMQKQYSKAPKDKWFRKFLREMAEVVDEAAETYAHQLRIPVPVKKRTVAPTGTIAKLSGVSEGVHPIFSKYFLRRIRFSILDPDQRETLNRYEAEGYITEVDRYDLSGNTWVVEIPTQDSLVADVVARYGKDAEELVESAADLTLNEMLAFQALYQTCWADNAVSYTANVDPETYSAEDVRQQLSTFGGILKGATIFPEASMPQAPYERITKKQYEQATATAVADGVDENCANGACPIR
jgi:ribonucleoside-triphosphate reductase